MSIESAPHLGGRGRSGSNNRGGIVAFGAENIRVSIEQRVHYKYQRKFANAGIFKSLLIHYRIHRVVARKMKKSASPYALYSAR